MKKYKTLALALALSTIGVVGWATNSQFSITADTMEYDGNTKIANVTGNVIIVNGNDTVTGNSGWYNFNTKVAQLDGGVNITGPDLQGSASSLEFAENEQINAHGSVYLQKGTEILQGSSVQYNLNTGHGVVSYGSVATKGTSLSANKIEASLREIHIVGQGNVHLKSEQDDLTASGDHIDYRQTPNQKDGIAIITGNAHAVQKGNSLSGPEIIVNVQDNSIQTKQRSKLVIQQ